MDTQQAIQLLQAKSIGLANDINGLNKEKLVYDTAISQLQGVLNTSTSDASKLLTAIQTINEKNAEIDSLTKNLKEKDSIIIDLQSKISV